MAAAVLAAAMSSIAAELNALSTATVVDFYRRYARRDGDDACGACAVGGIRIPAGDEGARGVAPAKRHGAEDVAGLQPSGGDRLGEGDRDARRRGVAVAVEVDEDLLHRE